MPLSGYASTSDFAGLSASLYRPVAISDFTLAAVSASFSGDISTAPGAVPGDIACQAYSPTTRVANAIFAAARFIRSRLRTGNKWRAPSGNAVDSESTGALRSH